MTMVDFVDGSFDVAVLYSFVGKPMHQFMVMRMK